MVTTQSVLRPTGCAATANSLMMVSRISRADTASELGDSPVQSVRTRSVPCITALTFGLTLPRFGEIEPGA